MINPDTLIWSFKNRGDCVTWFYWNKINPTAAWPLDNLILYVGPDHIPSPFGQEMRWRRVPVSTLRVAFEWLLRLGLVEPEQKELVYEDPRVTVYGISEVIWFMDADPRYTP